VRGVRVYSREGDEERDRKKVQPPKKQKVHEHHRELGKYNEEPHKAVISFNEGLITDGSPTDHLGKGKCREENGKTRQTYAWKV